MNARYTGGKDRGQAKRAKSESTYLSGPARRSSSPTPTKNKGLSYTLSLCPQSVTPSTKVYTFLRTDPRPRPQAVWSPWLSYLPQGDGN